MPTENTLLILGAGASIPYGFPSGRALSRDIWRLVLHPDENRVFNLLGFADADVQAFKEQFRRADMSIDEFLNANQHLGDLGKAMIAMQIIRSENRDELTSPESSHWYRFLWDVIRPHLGDLAECKIRILTFNYDRSLEQYLVDAIKAFTGKSFAPALEILGQLGIVHVYGDVGRLGLIADTSAGERPYESHSTIAQHIEIGAARLRLMRERNDPETGEDEARSHVEWAQVICFLGFGYDPLNLRRLGFKGKEESVKSGDRRACFGTTFGLSQHELVRVRSTFANFHFTPAFQNDDCEAYLRNSGLIGVRVGL
jgi:hypothetical protein